ncbi:hypothetical protein [Paenibacillus sp. Soil787]|uniref:hypothetical protein n=1 Tax=Paenibacillus sp. Soil787 TaxID=1736411 RepID=UPI0012E369AD|nr:hypothetical protein [Paenibacillus sp. Soil787]
MRVPPEWSRVLAAEVFQVNHRHVILTIDEGLRDVFLKIVRKDGRSVATGR